MLESKLAAKPGKMDVGDSPSRLELKLSQEDKSRISQLAVDSAVISAPDNQSMLRVTLEPGIAEDIFDSIQALVAGNEVDVTKLALRGSAEFIPTKNPVIKQAMAQAAGELTGEKAALVEQLGKYQGLREAIKTPPKKPFAAQVEKYRETLERKEASTKKQLNNLLDRVDTMVQRGMLSQSQADKITRRTPGEPRRMLTESGQMRFMPDYSGEHRAPGRDSGAPLDNLKDVYPDDVYGPNAARYYGHESGSQTDKAAVRIIQATKGKPDAPVKVFRAIPKSIQSNEINPGDWITTIKSYAVQHGEGPLGGDYKILEKTVPAGDLYTDGNSIFEFGYDPKYMPATIQREVGRNIDFANPPTDAQAVDALSSEKKAKFGKARNIKAGTQVAARIDIPAFLRNGTYVVALHEPDGPSGGPGKVIGYDSAARLKNPRFVVKPGVQRIYEGKSAKFPVATVDGQIIADRSIPADLDTWVPVGMDPKEHAYFYDKRTDQPVTGGSESFSVGNTVFVKDPVYGRPEEFRYMPSPDSSMPGAYSFPGGYRALPGKTKGSLRLYGPAGSLIGIASSLEEAQRIIRRKTRP